MILCVSPLTKRREAGKLEDRGQRADDGRLTTEGLSRKHGKMKTLNR
jgi:hypothetical protein